MAEKSTSLLHSLTKKEWRIPRLLHIMTILLSVKPVDERAIPPEG